MDEDSIEVLSDSEAYIESQEGIDFVYLINHIERVTANRNSADMLHELHSIQLTGFY